MRSNLAREVRQRFNDDFTLMGLRVFITLWAIAVAILVWFIDNKWILAGIAAYEVLP